MKGKSNQIELNGFFYRIECISHIKCCSIDRCQPIILASIFIRLQSSCKLLSQWKIQKKTQRSSFFFFFFFALAKAKNMHNNLLISAYFYRFLLYITMNRNQQQLAMACVSVWANMMVMMMKKIT